MVTNATKETAALNFSRYSLYHPEARGSRIFQDTGVYVPDYAVSHARRHSSSNALLSETQITQKIFLAKLSQTDTF
jgi:hypothetical protein